MGYESSKKLNRRNHKRHNNDTLSDNERKRTRTKSTPSTRSYSSRSQSPSVISDRDATDDKVGLVDYKIGEYIYDRYKIIGLSGQGTFGTVLDCYDNYRKQRVAIKVVRSVRRYLDAATAEVRILQTLSKRDPDHCSLCVRLKKYFTTVHHRRRHVFLVFDRLGDSLYEFIKANDYRGFSLKHTRELAFQLLKAVEFCHSIGLIHTDLKPENVLLVDDSYTKRRDHNDKEHYRIPKSTEIRLIDFGGATFDKEHHARMINTRQYRAPEVMLGIGWSFASDIWSLGCIIAELFTGELLFGTHENAEHFAMMEHVLQKKIPSSMINKSFAKFYDSEKSKSRRALSKSISSKRHHHHKQHHRRPSSKDSKKHKNRKRSSSCPQVTKLFDDTSYTLKWPEVASSEKSKRAVKKTVRLSELTQDQQFEDLLRKLLEYDPKKRITCKKALDHPFFDVCRRHNRE